MRGKPEVRRYLQNRFTHIFIDEFQDTDPLQAEILLLLAAADASESDWLAVTPKPGKLFVVGDPKQSVYKFRRADVVLYRTIRDTLATRGVGDSATHHQLPRPAASPALRQQRFPVRNAGRCRSRASRVLAARGQHAADRWPAQPDRAAGAAALR